MRFFNPNTDHTKNIYEKGRYTLVWNLSVIVCIIFIFTSILFFSFDRLVFYLYLILLLTSVFALFYLKKYKKVKPIFWLYTIVSTVILIFSFHTLHHVLHYVDVFWTICLILFAFIGLEYKFALLVVVVHALSMVLFIYFNFNINIETVQTLPNYELLVFSIESVLAYIVFVILVQYYLKYQKFTRLELSKTKNKYHNVIENINEALIQDDKNGKIVFWNNKFLEMFKFSESDMKEKYIMEIINPEDHDTLRELHFQRINGQRLEDELMYFGKRKNGENIWMEINVTPIFEKGEIIGTQSLIRDVTIKKEQEIYLVKIHQELTKIEDAERERIAYELHDGLNQILISARLHMELSSPKEKLFEMIDSAISESKRIIQNLVPKDIKEFGLIYALGLLIQKTSESSKLKISFNFNNEFEFLALTEKIQFNVYRIVQECLNNTVKHAKANAVEIEMASFNNNLNVLFSNDGEIIPDEKLNNQSFLTAIKRRINILNGKFEIIENKNGKVTFLIVVPFEMLKPCEDNKRSIKTNL